VLGDVVVPDDPAQVRIVLTEGFDVPSSVAEQLTWLGAAGFDASLAWQDRDLAVLLGQLR
jgi:tRNA (cmo5U34)-methyltransferase